jgi:hypothetical protein
LQGDKILEELGGLWRPIGPVASAREGGTELGGVSQPAGAEAIKMGAANLKKLGSFAGVDLLLVKLMKDLLEKGIGEAFGELLF